MKINEFDNGLCRIKVKVTARLQTFSPLATIQTVTLYISALKHGGYNSANRCCVRI